MSLFGHRSGRADRREVDHRARPQGVRAGRRPDRRSTSTAQRAIAFAAGSHRQLARRRLGPQGRRRQAARSSTTKGQLNKEVLTKNPRLPDLYQDLAVAYIRAAKGDKAYCDSAKLILVPLIRNSDDKSKRYWEARYLHLDALKEAKDYAELDQTLDGLARTAPDADGGKFGIKPKIDAIRAFRDKKIVNK